MCLPNFCLLSIKTPKILTDSANDMRLDSNDSSMSDDLKKSSTKSNYLYAK